MQENKLGPKPIFLAGIPFNGDAKDLIKLEGIASSFKSKIGDEYHVLVYTTGLSEPTFQVFYEKDFNEVKYEELKAIITGLVKS